MNKIIFNITLMIFSIELSNCMLPTLPDSNILHSSTKQASLLQPSISDKNMYVSANYSLFLVNQQQNINNFLKIIRLQISPKQQVPDIKCYKKKNQIKNNDVTTQIPAMNLCATNGDLSLSMDINTTTSLPNITYESETATTPIQPTILLPKRGESQPSPKETVQWSCANIEDDNITNWYLSMFGLSQYTSATPKVIGYIGNCPRKIINFDYSMNKKSQDSFVQIFTTIASNSVGRVLLYRLLLETRNNIKKITIQESDHTAYLRNEDILKFPTSDEPHYLNVIGAINQDNTDLVNIVKHTARKDSMVFHEFLHWFHQLNNSARKSSEMNVNIGINEKPFDKVSMASHTPAYWITPINNRSIKNVKLEEMRTILGYTVPITLVDKKTSRTITSNKVFPSDDLSENLYRLCIGEPLRYGHNSLVKRRMEHLNAIEHVITSCTEAAKSGGYKIANASVSLGDLNL